MTITVESAVSGPMYPNGATLAFPFDFKINGLDEVQVLRQSATGLFSIVSPTLYVVTPEVDGEGGTITFSSAPLAVDGALYISGDPDFDQPANFSNNGFLPATLNPVFDAVGARLLYLRDRVLRTLRFPFGTNAPELPALASMMGMALGMSLDGRWIPLTPSSVAATDTLAITHEGVILAAILNSQILTAPAERISVVADTALDVTAINRFVHISGSATAIALAMPPTAGSNVGDCILLFVDRAQPGLTTCSAYASSGHLFGEDANRVMHAGEVALMMFTGTGWTKVIGVTRPFCGALSSVSSVTSTYGVDALNWKGIPCTLADADQEPSQPWLSVDHFATPRKSWWAFNFEVWFNGITMAAPTYGHTPGNATYAAQALSGTEQGVPVDVGTSITYNASLSPADFSRMIVHYNQPFQTFPFAYSNFLGVGSHVGPVFRLGSSALTAITAVYSSATIRTRWSFREVPVW